MEGASDAVLIADVATGYLTYANAAACKMFDCTPDYLIGLHQTKLHPEEELEYIREKFREFTTTDHYKETTAHIITKTGKRKLVMITAANAFEQDGRKFASAYFKDISYVEALQDIAYQQSHLVRRPLANILGITQLLTDDTQLTEEERKSLLADLRSSAEELDDVVRTLAAKTALG